MRNGLKEKWPQMASKRNLLKLHIRNVDEY